MRSAATALLVAEANRPKKLSRSVVARPRRQKVGGSKPQGPRLRTTRPISRSEVETRRLRARPGASRHTSGTAAPRQPPWAADWKCENKRFTQQSSAIIIMLGG